MYAQNRPSAISMGTALEHNINGFQTTRAIILLMGVTGNIDRPGGNVYYEPIPLKDIALFEKLPPEQVRKKVGPQFKGLAKKDT